MTVYVVPATRSYQRPFRMFGSAAILSLLVIFGFSLFEPSGTSDTTNLVLAVVAGGIVVASVIFMFLLSPKEAMWQLKHSFEWELNPDSLIQRQKNGIAFELPLNEIRSLCENRGWLIVSEGEPLRGIPIPSDIVNFEELKRELTSRCSVTPQRIRVKLLSFVPYLAGIAALVFLFASRVRVVIAVSGLIVLLVQIWALHFYRRILRGRPIPKPLLLVFL
jgi:hypothetical protein